MDSRPMSVVQWTVDQLSVDQWTVVQWMYYLGAVDQLTVDQWTVDQFTSYDLIWTWSCHKWLSSWNLSKRSSLGLFWSSWFRIFHVKVNFQKWKISLLWMIAILFPHDKNIFCKMKFFKGLPLFWARSMQFELSFLFWELHCSWICFEGLRQLTSNG